MNKQEFINKLYARYFEKDIQKEDISKMLSRGFLKEGEDFLDKYLNNEQNFFEKYNKYIETREMLTAYEFLEELKSKNSGFTQLNITEGELVRMASEGILDKKHFRNIALNSDIAAEQSIQQENTSIKDRALWKRTESSYNVYLFYEPELELLTREFWIDAKNRLDEILEEEYELERDEDLEQDEEDKKKDKKQDKKEEEKHLEHNNQTGQKRRQPVKKPASRSSSAQYNSETPLYSTPQYNSPVTIPLEGGKYISIEPVIGYKKQEYSDATSYSGYDTKTESLYSGYDTENARLQTAAALYDFDSGKQKVMSQTALAEITSYIKEYAQADDTGFAPIKISIYDDKHNETVLYNEQTNEGSIGDFHKAYYDSVDPFNTADYSKSSQADTAFKYSSGAITEKDISKDNFSVTKDEYGNTKVTWNAPEGVSYVNPAVYDKIQEFANKNFGSEEHTYSKPQEPNKENRYNKDSYSGASGYRPEPGVQLYINTAAENRKEAYPVPVNDVRSDPMSYGLGGYNFYDNSAYNSFSSKYQGYIGGATDKGTYGSLHTYEARREEATRYRQEEQYQTGSHKAQVWGTSEFRSKSQVGTAEQGYKSEAAKRTAEYSLGNAKTVSTLGNASSIASKNSNDSYKTKSPADPTAKKTVVITATSMAADGSPTVSTMLINNGQNVNIRTNESGTFYETSFRFINAQKDSLPDNSSSSKMLSMAESFEKAKAFDTITVQISENGQQSPAYAVNKDWLRHNTRQANDALNEHRIEKNSASGNTATAQMLAMLQKAQKDGAIEQFKEKAASASKETVKQSSSKTEYKEILEHHLVMLQSANIQARQHRTNAISNSVFQMLKFDQGTLMAGDFGEGKKLISRAHYNMNQLLHTPKLAAMEINRDINRKYMNLLLTDPRNASLKEITLAVKKSKNLKGLDPKNANIESLHNIFRTGSYNGRHLTAEELRIVQRLIHLKTGGNGEFLHETEDGKVLSLANGAQRRQIKKDVHKQLKASAVLGHAKADSLSNSAIKKILATGKYKGREISAKDRALLNMLLKARGVDNGDFGSINGIDLLNAKFTTLNLSGSIKTSKGGRAIDLGKISDIKITLKRLNEKSAEYSKELKGLTVGAMSIKDIDKFLKNNKDIDDKLKDILEASKMLKAMEAEKELAAQQAKSKHAQTLRMTLNYLLGGSAAGVGFNSAYKSIRLSKTAYKLIKTLKTTMSSYMLLSKLKILNGRLGETKLGEKYRARLMKKMNKKASKEPFSKKMSNKVNRQVRKVKLQAKRKIRATKASKKARVFKKKVKTSRAGKAASSIGHGVSKVASMPFRLLGKAFAGVSFLKQSIQAFKKILIKYAVIAFACLTAFSLACFVLGGAFEIVTGFLYAVVGGDAISDTIEQLKDNGYKWSDISFDTLKTVWQSDTEGSEDDENNPPQQELVSTNNENTLINDRLQFCIAMDSAFKEYIESFYDNESVVSSLTDVNDERLKDEGENWHNPVTGETFKKSMKAVGTKVNGINTGLHYTFYDGDGNIISMKSNAKDIIATANAWIGSDLSAKGLYKTYVEALWSYSHAVGYNLRQYSSKYIYSCDSHAESSECHDNICLYYCTGIEMSSNLKTNELYAALAKGTVHAGLDYQLYYNDAKDRLLMNKTIGSDTDTGDSASLIARKESIASQQDTYKGGYSVPTGNREYYHTVIQPSDGSSPYEAIAMLCTHPQTGEEYRKVVAKKYAITSGYEGEDGSYAWVNTGETGSGCVRHEPTFHVGLNNAQNWTDRVWVPKTGEKLSKTFTANADGSWFSNTTTLYPYSTLIKTEFYNNKNILETNGCENIGNFQFAVLLDSSGNMVDAPATTADAAQKLRVTDKDAYYCQGDLPCSGLQKKSVTKQITVHNDTLHESEANKDIKSSCSSALYHGSKEVFEAGWNPKELEHSLGMSPRNCNHYKTVEIEKYHAEENTAILGSGDHGSINSGSGKNLGQRHWLGFSVGSCSEYSSEHYDVHCYASWTKGYRNGSYYDTRSVSEFGSTIYGYSDWPCVPQGQTLCHYVALKIGNGEIVRHYWTCNRAVTENGYTYCPGHPESETHGVNIYYCKGEKMTYYQCLGHCPGHKSTKEQNITINYCSGYCMGHEMVEYCNGHVDLDVGVVTVYNDDTNGLTELGAAKKVDVTTNKYYPRMENGYKINESVMVPQYTVSNKNLSNFLFSYDKTPNVKENLSQYVFVEYKPGGGKNEYELPKYDGKMDAQYVNNYGSIVNGPRITRGIAFMKAFIDGDDERTVGEKIIGNIINTIHALSPMFNGASATAWDNYSTSIKHNNIETNDLDRDGKITLSDILGYYFISFETDDYMDLNDDLSFLKTRLSNLKGVTSKFNSTVTNQKTHYFEGFYEYKESDDGKTATIVSRNGKYVDTGNISRVDESMQENWLSLYDVQFPGSYNKTSKDSEIQRLAYTVAYATMKSLQTRWMTTDPIFLPSMYKQPTAEQLNYNLPGTGFLSPYEIPEGKLVSTEKTSDVLGKPTAVATSGSETRGTQDGIDFALNWGAKFYKDLWTLSPSAVDKTAFSAYKVYEEIYNTICGSGSYYVKKWQENRYVPQWVYDVYTGSKATAELRYSRVANSIDSFQNTKSQYVLRKLAQQPGFKNFAKKNGDTYDIPQSEVMEICRNLKAGDLVGIGDEIYLVIYTDAGLGQISGYDSSGNPIFKGSNGYQKGKVYLATAGTQLSEPDEIIHIFAYSLELLGTKRDMVWVYSA